MILIELLYNLTLLVALSIISGFVEKRYPRTKLSGLFFQGFLFGIVAIIGMMRPLIFSEGLIFDGRSVVLSLAALFFGPVSGAVAGILAIIYRLSMGGSGSVVGTLVITSSVIIGIIFHFHRKKTGKDLSISQLFYFGFAVQIAMLLMMFYLPFSTAISIIQRIGIYIILIYPLATVLIGKILSDQEVNARNFEKIKASEEKYRYMFANNPQPMFIYDLETLAFLEINNPALRTYGFTKKEFLSMNLKDIHPAEDIDALLKDVELARRADNLGSERRHLKKNGEIINVEIISSTVLFNNRKARHVMVTDISKRRKAEEALRNNETLLHTLVQTIPDLVWLKDRDGVYLACNPVFERLYGAKEADIVGKTDYDFVDKEMAEHFREHDRKAMEKGKPTSNEEWLTFADDGHKIFSETVKTPMYDKTGELNGVLGIGRDLTERLKAEESLLKLSRAVEQSPVSVIITDPLGEIEYVNEKFCSVTGYSRQEVIGNNPSILKSGLQDSNYYESLWDTIISGKEWKGELQNKKKNGELFWESVLISPLINKNGDITHFIAVKEDITEQKIIRASLLVSEERYKAIFNNSVELVYIFDLHGNILEANKKALALFGYTEEEAKSLNISDIIDPVDLPTAKTNIAYVIANGANKDIQTYQIRTKRKDTIYLETTGVRLDKVGKPFAIMGIARDITNNRLAEKALKESEKKYRELFEKILDGVYKSTHEGKFIQVNQAMVKMLGYNNKQELYDLNIKTELYFQDGDRESAALEEKYEEMAIFRIKKKDGSELWVEDHGRHILDDRGNVLYHEGVMRDVTERLRIEEELIKAKDKAEEMNRLKTNFLANMSHELRTPLIGILGYAEFLENELKEKDLLQMVTTIKNSGKRLNTTLNNILDISRIDSGKQQINLKEQDIIKYLIEQVELFSIVAEGKGLTLNFETKEKILNVFTNEEMFVSIISNLLNNAIKFSLKGDVVLRAMQQEDKAVIEIEDQGIGISEDSQEIIFEPFRQASDGLNRRFEGTGLGLTIVKKYLDLIGGTITMNSEPGKGTKFELKFPLHKNNGNKLIITKQG